MSSVAEALAQAKAHQLAGDSRNAEQCCRRALAVDPGNVEALFLLGAACHGLGRLDEAAASLAQALRQKPDYAEAHHQLGQVLLRQGRLDAAIDCLQQAWRLRPAWAQADHGLRAALAAEDYNAANTAAAQGKLDEAAARYRRAAALKPDFAEAWHNLGAVLDHEEQLDAAAACYRHALELKPDFAEAHHNLGGVLSKQDDLDAAAASCRRALELKPDLAETHNNLGLVLLRQERLEEAIACFRRALELKPNFAEASNNLGIQLTRQGKLAEAKECYLKAWQAQPRQDVWKLNILALCPSIATSNEEIDLYRSTLLEELAELSRQQPSFELSALMKADCKPSFNLPFHGRDDRPIREAYATLFRPCFPVERAKGSGGRPRIGFVVTDRREPVFLRSMGGILDRMNRDLFEVVVIGSHRSADIFRSGLRNPATRLLQVPTKLEHVSNTIRAAQFDLLYYWEIGTDTTNYFLPFFRLAPVQCTSWGIQVTSGNPQIDCYLSSELAEPDDASGHYTERLVLARTLLTYQRRCSLGDSPKPREHFGISPDRHLYLCAQQLGKFHPDFDPVLAGILRGDPQAVIVITKDRHGGFIADQLRQRFAATIGDVADRILFIPPQPTGDYLSLIAAADVLLDPLHFGGVNSTYDGFSFDKPIVTLPSRFQRGRYTLACYKKLGVFDCVASDSRQYVDIALALGTDARYRQNVEQKIRQASGVLFEDAEAISEHERIFTALVAEARSAGIGAL